MSVQLRRATANDSTTLAKLRHTFRTISDQDLESEADFIARCSEWMAQRLNQELWRCWVIEKDDEIVGALWLQIIEKIPNPTAEPEFHAYITNVFVKESLRGAGLGSQLLTEALTFCKNYPVHSIILWPSEKSRPLYERHGFSVKSKLLASDMI